MKLIDKDALATNIDNILDYADEHWDTDYVIGAQRFADKLQNAIGTLEMKEVDNEPVSEDLEVEVDRWYNNEAPKEFEGVLYADIEKCAKHFADWQKEKDQKIIKLAEDHAMLAGMEKMKEQMMECVIDGLRIRRNKYTKKNVLQGFDVTHDVFQKFKDGDNLKVILIKED